ncbi:MULTISPECIES: cyanoexosortase A system-associated protein [unclassified Synechocystis]|uniref:cyanoexosortase A system-associated protein n=1 Tax=unclassified Synechocystis TaxID=2640012 RepID=UPI001EEFCCE0|nr:MULTISPECIES: cyanoexosortase A system-associated protein [unclassified Synechocystis]
MKTLSEHPFPYPQQVTLPSWQLKNSKTAIVAGKSPGQRYILQKGDITATITACLNPNAPSTLTEQQFISNKYRHNLHFFAWLAGQKDLTDSSCLWTLISAPIAPDATPDEITQTFQQLETAWVEWYQWWQLH